MPANTVPIFSLAPRTSWGTLNGDDGAAGPITTAQISKDGTGVTPAPTTIFTAGAQGSFIQEVRIRVIGSNASATVMRLFINNGSVHTTIANNILIDEISIPITTLSETAAQNCYSIPCNFALPASYKLMVTFGTGGAAGWRVSAIGSDY